MTRRALLAILSAGLILGACSGSGSDSRRETGRSASDPAATSKGPRGMWAGPLAGSDLYLAVVANGEQVVAYACDRGKTSVWFAGTDDKRLVLRSRKGAALDVTMGTTAKGTFALPGGPPVAFDLPATGAASLFRAEGGNVTNGVLAGWIKLPDGSSRGALQSGPRDRGLPTVSVPPALAPTPTTPVAIAVAQLPPLDLGPQPMTPETLGAATLGPKPKFRWVGMGDSFASGEGNPIHGIAHANEISNFSGLVWGTNPAIFVSFENATDLARDVVTCHRSDRAGAPQANEQLKTLFPELQFEFGFVACGGAETPNLINDGYTGPETRPESRNNNPPIAQPSQIDRAKAFAGSAGLNALYFSAGGNDAGFGALIAACLSPVPSVFGCEHDWGGAGGILAQRTGGLEDAYDAVDAKIKSAFGTQIPNVLISAYPNPIDDGAANSGLSKPVCFREDYDARGETGIGKPDDILRNNLAAAEADFAFGAAAVISSAVTAAATKHGWIPVTSHVAASRGHGYCTADPWFNLNSKALHTQGRDNPQPVPFSDGLLHPNDKGFTAYANAIVQSMQQPVFSALLNTLQPPTNVRIGAAQNGGAITVRWNDRAAAENAFEVEVMPVDQQALQGMIYPPNVSRIPGSGYIQRISGANLQEYIHDTNRKGLYRYRVRACNSRIVTAAPQTTPACGAFSAPASGANFSPTLPTGVTFTNSSFRSGTITVRTSILNWNAQPEALEFVVRRTPKPGTAGSRTDTRLTTTSLDLGATAGAANSEYQAAACNRVGCSVFTPGKSPPP